MGGCTSKSLDQLPVEPSKIEQTDVHPPLTTDCILPDKLSNELDLPSHLKPITVLQSTNDEVCGSIELKLTIATDDSKDHLLSLIRDSIIGKDAVVWTPFGKRRLVYADYTASGRLLGFVEEYLRSAVYPLYANTHTEASATGFQTTVLREEARDIIARSINAPIEEYVTLFTGTGCTGAIDKLGRVLGLQIPPSAAARWRLLDHIPEAERPVVFHGPFEHHTNELWWRESIATVVAIEEGADGRPDLEMLARELERYATRPLKIGSFSAGSNVTGIRADTTALAELLHAHGALAFFDFAGVGAYIKIDMKPPPSKPGADPSIDAMFLSPHKFIGGPGSSGLLVARRHLFSPPTADEHARPTCPGGGTVRYVSPAAVDYEQEAIEAREDAGTPGILQAIRCGIAFKVKEAVGCDRIEAAEQAHGRAALEAWRAHPQITLLGADRADYFDYERRVSIISFNIRAPEGIAPSRASAAFLHAFGGQPILHPHFVIQVLNDLYGIQGRSGCSCTGPYGHRLYGIAAPGDECAATMRHLAAEHGEHAAKLGWARVNFNYFIDEAEAQFVRDAVLQIATHGWRLLPYYQIDPKSGQFTHRSFERHDALRSLAELEFVRDGCTFRVPCQDTAPLDHAKVLEEAEVIYKSAAKTVVGWADGNTAPRSMSDFTAPPSDELLTAVWWCMPNDAATLLRAQVGRVSTKTVRYATEIKGALSQARSSASSRRSTQVDSSLQDFEDSAMHKIMRPRG